jgi:hypothetical protein
MSKLTRRQAVGTVAAVAAGAAVAGVAASANASPERGTGSTPAAHAAHSKGPAPFDEVFQGRRIQGVPAAEADGAPAHGQHHTPAYRVLIDGRELHVMPLPDGRWTSSINHYERFATPHAAARTAVTSLRGARLVPVPHTA